MRGSTLRIWGASGTASIRRTGSPSRFPLLFSRFGPLRLSQGPGSPSWGSPCGCPRPGRPLQTSVTPLPHNMWHVPQKFISPKFPAFYSECGHGPHINDDSGHILLTVHPQKSLRQDHQPTIAAMTHCCSWHFTKLLQPLPTYLFTVPAHQ